MKKILFSTLICLFAWFQAQASDSNEMIVISTDNSQTAYVISNIEKITFNSGVMTVHSTNADSNHDLLTTRKIVFSLVDTSDKNANKESSNIKVYPNPVVSTIYINGIPENEALSIYSIKGEKFAVNKNPYEGTTSINVSNLPTGIYILQIGTQSVKFTKK